MGTTGSVLVLLMIMMAVTSTGSAEIIAVTSILVYDFYQLYFKVSILKSWLAIYSLLRSQNGKVVTCYTDDKSVKLFMNTLRYGNQKNLNLQNSVNIKGVKIFKMAARMAK